MIAVLPGQHLSNLSYMNPSCRRHLPAVFFVSRFCRKGIGREDEFEMTMALNVVDICKEWNGRPLFEGLRFELAVGEKAAVFGRNGTGKSTLLQILIGEVEQDTGRIERHVPVEEWGWIHQSLQVDDTVSLLDFVKMGETKLWELAVRMQEVEEKMTGEPENLQTLLDEYGKMLEQFEQMSGYDWESRAEKSLRRLNLSPALWSVPFVQLSGGQKTRAQIARLMASSPKFLLLDEPTNHLDQESLSWLEAWVKNYEGTVLFVSHDREFLDQTADCILELTPSGIKCYKGGYSQYCQQKEVEKRTQEALYKKQEQARKELEECIRNYQQWFHQASRASSQVEVGVTKSYYAAKAKKNISRYHAKQKQLERLEAERVDKPRESPQLNLTLESEAFGAQTLLRLSEVSYAYGDRRLFHGLNLSVNKGDRLAVLGPNGAGKSTLLRVMTGEYTPCAGVRQQHPQARIGYFSQELEGLDTESTILDSLLCAPWDDADFCAYDFRLLPVLTG